MLISRVLFLQYFSRNGKPTIRTIDEDYQDIIGKASGLSFQDIKLANIIYKCNCKCISCCFTTLQVSNERLNVPIVCSELKFSLCFMYFFFP